MERKFTSILDAEGLEIEVWTPEGFVPVTKIGRTVPYEKWRISANGRELVCADDHIVITPTGPKKTKNLVPGEDAVLTDVGVAPVEECRPLGEKEEMYDLEMPTNVKAVEFSGKEKEMAYGASVEGRLCSVKVSDVEKGDCVKTTIGYRDVYGAVHAPNASWLFIDENSHTYYTNGILSHNTLFLCHFACSFSLRGKRVLYFSLEMSDLQIFQRLEANLLDISIREIGTENPESARKRKEKFKKFLEENPDFEDIRVVAYPSNTCTVSMIEEKLMEFEKDGWKADVVVVDQINSMSGMGSEDNMFKIYKNIAVGLKSLSQKHGVIVLAGTQPNRKGMGKNAELGMDTVGESVAIPQFTDIFMTFRKEDRTGVADGQEVPPSTSVLKCHMEKDRIGGGGTTFRLLADLDKMRLMDYEE